MSGIAGIYRRDGRVVDRGELKGLAGALSHRGLDGCGIWSQGSVGLGHLMLWTTPESRRERLPLVSRTGDLVLTADVRLDNRRELLDLLGLSGQPGREITDGELILSAYEKWGEDCPRRLLGDFAFAIWDGARQRLFCARDHFGVKPLYYFASPALFAFGTEIKALLALTGVPRKLDEVSVAYYLSSVFDDTERTFYQRVRRLPPAHSLSVSRQDLQLWRYWSLDPSRTLRLSSDQEYAEGFREIFTDAVDSRLRSAHPVGSFLSGGLDSSAITCVARDLLRQSGGQRLSAFSAVFEAGAQHDERPYIDAVLAKNSITSHPINGDSLSPLREYERVLWHEDEPLYAFNLFLNWSLYEAAQGQGVRVMLDGFDGDTTVSHGTGYLTELARSGRWLALAREARGLERNFAEVSAWRLTWRYACAYGIGRRLSRLRPVRSFRRRWRSNRRAEHSSTPAISGIALNPAFARRLDLAERLRSLHRPAPATEREHHYRSLTWGVMPYTLEVLDRAAAAFHIESRYPFWDRRLVEYCLSLPPEQKIRRGWTRLVMRRALEGILPAKIQWRGGKSNLGGNFEKNLIAFEKERLDDVVLRNPGEVGEYLDVPSLQKSYRRMLNRPGGQDTVTVWKAINLALWLRQSAVKA